MSVGPIRRVRRQFEGFFDRIATRPLSMIVFAASVVVLISVQFGAFTRLKAPAVGAARPVAHPSGLDSVVVEVHVEPGDLVAAGSPLVSLSSRDAERELRLLDAEIARIERLSVLEQARLADTTDADHADFGRLTEAARLDLQRARAEELTLRAQAKAAGERTREVRSRVEARTAPRSELDDATWNQAVAEADLEGAKRAVQAAQRYLEMLEQTAAGAAAQSMLTGPTAELYHAELDILRVRRDILVDDLRHVTVSAATPGRIADVVAAGSRVTRGTSVVTILPAHATEIVAYIPASSSPDSVLPGTRVAVTEPPRLCDQDGAVLRTGAEVLEAPGQIRSFFSFPVHGWPVHISIPDDCAIGVGQILSVEFDKAGP